MEDTNTSKMKVAIPETQGKLYPTVSDRLRVAHEQNEKLSIVTEIIQHDQSISIVKAICTTSKGKFEGTGTASSDRDKKIAPALLELAETRGVSRALRFAGYCLEYCGAEEVSHINGFEAHLKKPLVTTGFKPPPDHDDSTTRLSGKQYKYVLKLMGNKGSTKKEMDEHCINTYGASLMHISKNDASSLIESLIEE